MPYESASDIIEDALFRAGEISGQSEWGGRVVDYLNRSYRGICSGASEFLPEYIDDWWWLRDRGVLTLDPVYQTGTVSVTNGSMSITFSVSPGINFTNWRFRVVGHPDAFIISSHGGSTIATIDSPYTGDTNTAASFEAMHVTYSLETGVAALMSPIASFRDNPQIFGVSPERMDFLFPLQRLQAGVPVAFSLENEQTIRFSHGGLTDKSMRMEYTFRPVVTDLENNTSSIPLIPLQWRHVLADMTLVHLYLDKNDDRAVSIGSSARAVLSAMVRENRRRIVKMDNMAGAIIPRAGRSSVNRSKLLRTESGLIIG